jgi:hypothetical protein
MQKKILAAALALAFLGANANADDVSDRAAFLASISDKVQKGDIYARIAIFEDLLKKKDPTVTQIAVKAALATPEPDLRAAALRAWFDRNSRFVVERIVPKEARETNEAKLARRKYSNDPGYELELYSTANARSSLALINYNPDSGEGRVGDDAADGRGSYLPFKIQGDVVTFQAPHAFGGPVGHIFTCLYGPMKLIDGGAKLAGPFNCNYPPPPGSSAEVRLY